MLQASRLQDQGPTSACVQQRGRRRRRRRTLRRRLTSDICICLWTPGSAWWSQRGGPTRPHSELGRETPPRPGYCPTRGGRAGRRQVEPGSPEIRGSETDDRDQMTALGQPAPPSDAAGCRRTSRSPSADLPARHDSLPDPRGPDPPSAVCPLTSVLCPLIFAGWSSPVARQAHNLKVAGSNPAPATSTSPRPTQTSRAVCPPLGGVAMSPPGSCRACCFGRAAALSRRARDTLPAATPPSLGPAFLC